MGGTLPHGFCGICSKLENSAANTVDFEEQYLPGNAPLNWVN
jgi:hypothetical protein